MTSPHRPSRRGMKGGLVPADTVELDAFRALLAGPRETVGELCRRLDIEQTVFLEYWHGDRPIPRRVMSRVRDVLIERAEETRQLAVDVSRRLHLHVERGSHDG